MTVRDCFSSALIPRFGAAFPVFYFITFSFVTKFSFSLTKYLLKSEEFCLFESYEDGQDISCRSMMFGASRYYGRYLSFFYKDTIPGRRSCPVPDFVFFLSLPTSQDWPTIGTRIHQRITNACIGNGHLCHFYSSFLFTAMTVSERRCLFLIEAGRIAMGRA
jgi:hypothetical protein